MSCNKSEHVPLSVLLKRESANQKADRPEIACGQANESKKGEDFALIKTECQRVLGDGVTTYSVFGIFDGHNGSAAAIYTKENLLNNVLCAIPPNLNRDEWVAALPRAMVAGFVKTDKDFQEKAQILDTNEEERERVTASGGEVGRLNTGGGTEIGPLRCWPGGLCLSRSIGDRDVGEFIVPVPHLSSAGGRLVISSDGVWDALSAESALECSRGLAPESAAAHIVKEAVQVKGLRDDTTCIVVDVLPPEKTNLPLPPPKMTGKRVLKAMFRKKSSEAPPHVDEEEYYEPDLVEELVEEGSAMLSQRLDTKYPLCNIFRLFICAVCQIEMKPGEGISIHHGSANMSGKSKPWDGPFLCVNCQYKKDAMEGKISSKRR
ncbi:unnamed protein product [Lactuca virosa]|uniref:PPM-type phosphatase domain-containing protein n=1 Tax=Lactuca virosa TaxID=75947 RepID=A0AAU9PVS3_9ASTR|nr:unnamed protein product [Lactuca virosa]